MEKLEELIQQKALQQLHYRELAELVKRKEQLINAMSTLTMQKFNERRL